MPELSRFFGIIIRMFYSDHEPAHFHALIEIETLMVFRGSLRAERSRWCWNGLHCTAPNYVKTGSGRAPEKR